MRAVGYRVFVLPAVAAVVAIASGHERLVAQAADEAPRLIPRTESVIVVDGHIDDAGWEVAERFVPVVHVPNFGAEPSEPTEFRIVHDGEHLYFACLSHDSQPDRIRAASLRRDETGFTSDRCAILIDAANDEETAVAFYTSPAGIRSDYTYTGDGSTVDPNWDSFWEVAVSRDERGWYGEFRIPFSSLLFEPDDGRAVMGVSMLRNIARENEMSVYPAVSPRWERGWGKASLMQRIVMDDVAQSNPVYITPYALVGGGYTRSLNGAGTGYRRATDRITEAGLDVRYSPAANLTLDLTANTDFAQVEADEQQVNLTRFSLFFPEKRRFFQERSSTFEFSLGGDERLFHSRRMGLAGGAAIRVFGGVRLVGRIGEWDLGLLNIQTAESDSLPAANQGVVRIRRGVLNPHSYVGAIVTSQLGARGGRNIVYGLDALVRVRGDDYVTLNWAQSFDDLEGDAGNETTDFLGRGLVRVTWERRGLDGLTYSLDVSRAGNAFEPRLGFLQRRDYSKAAAVISYGWRPAAQSPLLRYAAGLESTMFRRNGDGSLETAIIQPNLFLATKSGHQFTIAAPFSYEDLRQDFSLSQGIRIPAGSYRFMSGSIQYGSPDGFVLKPNVVIEGGQFYDGHQISASFEPSWSPSRYLTLAGTYRVDHLKFADPERGDVTAHLAGLRTEVMLSASVAFLSFVQYNSTLDTVVSNFRFRYNPREGSDLYIVWNEGLSTEPYRLGSTDAVSTDRAIRIKYSNTFQLGF